MKAPHALAGRLSARQRRRMARTARKCRGCRQWSVYVHSLGATCQYCGRLYSHRQFGDLRG